MSHADKGRNGSAIMAEEPQEATANYICPTCGEPVERDILVFLRHTDRHIIETLKELHPEWVEADGEAPKIREFYRAQLGHNPW